MFQDFDSITFSDLKLHKNMVPSCKSSLLAYANKNELVVEKIKSEENRTRFVCDYKIDFISWSPDSELICCGMFKNSEIQIWNVNDLSWRCKISEGLLGITGITWVPDSRHLLVFCESSFRVTVWSFVSTEYTVIENPKFCKNNVSFSYCSRYMAVLTKKNTECIGIYSCDNWLRLKYFPICCENSAEIQFSPSELVLVVAASVSEEFKVLFYSIDGRLLSTFCKSNSFPGITSLCWNPKSNFILLGDYFENMTILDSRRFKEITNLNLMQPITSLETNIYRIFSYKEVQSMDSTCISNCLKYEVVPERPHKCSSFSDIKKLKKEVSKNGIQTLLCSNDGKYAAIVGCSMPNVLFLYKMDTFSLSDVIEHNSKLSSITWHPTKSILAFCCGGSSVDLWTPTCYIRLISPFENEFMITSAEWCNNEDAIVLNGKDNSAILYLP